MQLDRLVNFHKAVADPTRIRILVLLSKGPLHGQALAGKLGVTPPTVTHHVTKLREVGLIKERRDKNTIYFHLEETALKRYAEGIVDVVLKKESSGVDREDEKIEQERAAVIKSFYTPDGKLKQIPAQRKKKLIVFEYMLKGLEKKRKYTEQEINEFIKQFHEDYATIRREFIVNHYMYRENGIYELNPPEMWAKI
ncbi:metalloregulator ArsR/SmtB family transcription factor [Effusibacillus consociatus]|uniref:Metalloregulator ArsR/SmtB family transcription factor n=1 Tax=Effusibacillus consociatus TaxID=1117041 RepID=A0ABV9PXV5_9BACL